MENKADDPLFRWMLHQAIDPKLELYKHADKEETIDLVVKLVGLWFTVEMIKFYNEQRQLELEDEDELQEFEVGEQDNEQFE